MMYMKHKCVQDAQGSLLSRLMRQVAYGRDILLGKTALVYACASHHSSRLPNTFICKIPVHR